MGDQWLTVGEWGGPLGALSRRSRPVTPSSRPVEGERPGTPRLVKTRNPLLIGSHNIQSDDTYP